MNNIQKLIESLVSQGIILENEKESITLRCDENGCLVAIYDPTGQIVFNSCEEVTGQTGEIGPAGVIVNGETGPVGFTTVGTIGLVGTTTVGQTGPTGFNGADGTIGAIGFSPIGPIGDAGSTNIGPSGFTTVGQQGTNSTTTLNFPSLHINKTIDTLINIAGTGTPASYSYMILYDNVVAESISGMYDTLSNTFNVPYDGYYYINNTIFLELTNVGAVDTYGRIRYYNNSLSTYIDNGASMFSVLNGGNYNIQLRHENVLYLNKSDEIYFILQLFNVSGKTDILQKANSFTNEIVRSSQLYLYMISA